MSCGAVMPILAGLVPKVGAAIAAMPIAVLGGGVVVLFGMVAAAGLRRLSDVEMDRRNRLIVGTPPGSGLSSCPFSVSRPRKKARPDRVLRERSEPSGRTQH